MSAGHVANEQGRETKGGDNRRGAECAESREGVRMDVGVVKYCGFGGYFALREVSL